MPEALSKEEAKAKVDAAHKERRLRNARAALVLCTPEERSLLFAELSTCACSQIAAGAVSHPSALLGAVVGGIIGLAVETHVADRGGR